MEFVVLGEALIDLIQAGEGTASESPWTARSGGGPMNTAAGLGRQGADVAFLGRLSDDAFGRQLAAHLEAHDVSLDLAIRTSDPTTLAVVSLDDDGKASYAFHTRGTSAGNWPAEEFPEVPKDRWLHFGSIGVMFDDTFPSVHAFLSRLENPMSFDLNVRPSVIPDRGGYRSKIDALLAVVGGRRGIGKASDEDIAWLTNDGHDPVETAREWAARYGLGLFVVTLGTEGAVAVDADGVVARVPAHRVDVVDTVGAGDTFMAGFLSRFDGDNVEESLARGAAASALVCTKPGAQPPTADEVDEFLAR